MVAQAGSKLEIILSQSPECWNDRCILLCSACQWNFWFCIDIIQRKSLRKPGLMKVLHKKQQVQCGRFVKEDKAGCEVWHDHASTFQLCDFGKLIKSPWPDSPVIISNNTSTFAQSEEYEVPSAPCQSRSNLRITEQQWRQSTKIMRHPSPAKEVLEEQRGIFLLKEKIKRTSQKMI